MHPIDLIVTWVLGIGCLIFFVRAIRQISGFAFKCMHYAFVLTLVSLMLLIIYRTAMHILLEFAVTAVFSVELITISNFLDESTIVQYATKLIDSSIEMSHIEVMKDAWLYFQSLIK